MGLIALYSILIGYYYTKVTAHLVTMSNDLFTSILMMDLSLIVAWYYYVISDQSSLKLLILSDVFFLISLYYLYNYHDPYDFLEMKGLAKLVYASFMFILMSYLIGYLILPTNVVQYFSINYIFYFVNIAFIITMIRVCYFLIYENQLLKEYYSKHEFRQFKIFLILGFLIILSIAIFFFIDITSIQNNPAMGYVLTICIYSFLIFLYTKNPFIKIAFPTNIMWLGVLNDESNILYSRTISRNASQKTHLVDLNGKITKSFNSLNQLISEALISNLNILHLIGEKYSLFTYKIDGGSIICIVDQQGSSLVQHNYRKLLQKLVNITDSPFYSTNRIKDEPEKASQVLDDLLIPLERD